MFRTAVAIAALSLSASALAATTATITRIDGEVMVNQGEQFVAANAGQVVMTGDRLLVPQGGSLSLTFEDGCVMDVKADTLVQIPDASTCAGSAPMTQQVTPSGTGAAGGSAAAAGEDSAFGWGYLGTVLAVVLFYDPGGEGDNDTASP
jgi:hypothetical protein